MGKLRFRQVHLDFHTSEKIVEIGHEFDPQEFANTLKEAGVDSITCFARCHHGMIYYDTKFPARHPGLKRDLLREQIEACHAVDIRVPIYITVGWDEYMAARHPEWLERMDDGKPYGAGPLEAGWKHLCFNTPYIDYVEEQTIEVLEKFGDEVDGLFFDIISQRPCCCTYCIESMDKAGLNPENIEDREKFAKQVLDSFKRRMTATVRKYNKNCTIFYNAGHVDTSIRDTLDTYTHLELESLPSGGWGYEHFPITVRYARNLGCEYMGMTGKFHKSWADFGGFKNQPALEYECFMALANGAKCSIGDQLHPSGAINKATYKLIGSVYNQVKEKEPWCDDVVAVTEIGVLMTKAFEGAHIRLHPSLRGIYRMLEEAHYQFDFIDEHMDFGRYRVIVLPDLVVLNDTLKEKLENYVENGGKLLLSYKSGMDEALQQFVLTGIGAELVGDAGYSPDYVVAGEDINKGLLDTEYVMYDRGLWVKPLEGTRVLASIWNPYFNRSYKHFCSHRQTPVEKESGYPAVVQNGSIIYFAHPIFSMYHRHGARVYKQLVINALKLLLPEKLVETNAPTTAHMSLNFQQEHKRHVLHILHYIPERRFEEIDIIEDVIPLYNVEVAVKLPSKPEKVYCAPGDRSLDFEYNDGYAKVVVPVVKGHEMVVFE
ncbi:MAG: beta-galactosidase [Clostridiales bacterium]|nr:beta-galactosidase [Clostridiales bacterium]